MGASAALGVAAAALAMGVRRSGMRMKIEFGLLLALLLLGWLASLL